VVWPIATAAGSCRAVPWRGAATACLASAWATIAVASSGGVVRPGLLQEVRVNEQARVLQEFTGRVDAYVALHKKAEQTLPPLGSSAGAQEIATHQQALASTIRAARPRAMQGDIFTAPVRLVIRRLIGTALEGPGGKESLAAIRETSPIAYRPVVNAIYPDSIPVSTVPPNVLLQLPRLPEEVEYRFLARDLILRDTHAAIIVDFMVNAIR